MHKLGDVLPAQKTPSSQKSKLLSGKQILTALAHISKGKKLDWPIDWLRVLQNSFDVRDLDRSTVYYLI